MALNKNILRSSRPGGARPADGGRVAVLAVLKTGGLDDATRRRLEEAGLRIEQVIGNKLVASAPGARLDALRADPAVAELETAVQLKAHAAPGAVRPGKGRAAKASPARARRVPPHSA